MIKKVYPTLAIELATEEEPSFVKEILELILRPFDKQSEQEKYFAMFPEWARLHPGCLMLSCSS